VREGDFISFLYGARAHNLYGVVRREAIKDAQSLPPWPPVTFRESGRTYYFPFRLYLNHVREFNEPLVRSEFAYVAENLLLRAGYRKTHFQADQTTLQSVSEMGSRARGPTDALLLPEHATFTLRFTRNQKLVRTPEICRFREPILQSAVRRHLSDADRLQALLAKLDLCGGATGGLEILGEKALTEGHIDLLMKERVPIGLGIKVPFEVKTNRAQPGDVVQLRGYMDELRDDCKAGVLLAADFTKQATISASALGIRLVRYTLRADLNQAHTFEEIWRGLELEFVGK